MTRTPDAIVEPELLVWARKSIGFDAAQAARRIGVSAERLSSWEEGRARPTVAQLRMIAKVYKRPLAVFFLSRPPRDFQALRDYRRLPDAEVGHLTPELHDAIRRAHALRDAAMDLRALAGETITDPPRLDPAPSDPERFGEEMRDLLGVSLSQQTGWRDERRALNEWIDALTALDVLVLQVQRIPLAEMRGFSVSAAPLPAVVLNGGDFPRGRIFTLFHEFAHVLSNSSGICDLTPRQRARNPSDEVEVFCNRAAAAALMPASAFASDPLVRLAPADGRWSDEAVAALSARYSVSQEAVVRRLYTLDLTTWDFLQEKRHEYRQGFEAYREELTRQRREEKAGGPSWYRMKVRDLGRPYIELALDAYYRHEITGSDLTEYLEIKINQLPKLEAELALTGARD